MGAIDSGAGDFPLDQIPSEVAYYGSKQPCLSAGGHTGFRSRRSLPPLPVPTPGIFAVTENLNSTWTTSQRARPKRLPFELPG